MSELAPRFPLLLSGFMATGKSTVGRLVAAQLGATFVDLDQRIEEKAGRSIAVLFASEGEAVFRRLEQEELRRVLTEGRQERLVCSLGGGALVDRPVRLDALFGATVVTLTASLPEILRRAEASPGGRAARPLLAGDDPEARLRKLFEVRGPAYAECHGLVSTDHKAPERVASEVVALARRRRVPVASGLDSYAVDIVTGGGSARVREILPVDASGFLLVTDDNVGPLHAAPLQALLDEVCGPRQLPQAEVRLTPGEEHKNLESLGRIFEGAFAAPLDRKAVFLGLGGGVVTDMTGFAAATWVRGVRWIGVPSTLLSMVDASVGGKTAVDFRAAKNSVGAFWQPIGVICDVGLLATETDRAFRGALSEVVKTALLGDPTLFELLEDRPEAILAREQGVLEEIVERSVRVKARVVALDPRENGVRATLNLGHTFGHALESAGGYAALTHGEAVSLGLVAALRLGVLWGKTPPDLADRTLRLLAVLGLPHRLDRGELARAASLMALDKKRAGSQLKFVFARDMGDAVVEPVPLADLMTQAESLGD